MEGTLTRVQRAATERTITPIVRRLPPWLTPHHLTITRLVLAAPVALLALLKIWLPALILYLVAVLTDALDGELARFRKRESRVGAGLDPLVDRVLHLLLFLVFLPASPALLLAVIVLDAAALGAAVVAAVVARAARRPLPFTGANVFGKWKFFAQGLAIVTLFALHLAPARGLRSLLLILLLATILFSLLSLVTYARSFLSPRTRATPPL